MWFILIAVFIKFYLEWHVTYCIISFPLFRVVLFNLPKAEAWVSCMYFITSRRKESTHASCPINEERFVYIVGVGGCVAVKVPRAVEIDARDFIAFPFRLWIRHRALCGLHHGKYRCHTSLTGF